MHTYVLRIVPRIFIPLYPGYSYLHTPDIHTFIPRISYPGYAYLYTPDFIPGYSYLYTPDIHAFIPRISYPEYSYIYTPNIHIFIPRIFISSYPGYSYLHTLSYPDILTSEYSYLHTLDLIPRIFISIHPEYSYLHTSDLIPGSHTRIFISSYPGYFSSLKWNMVVRRLLPVVSWRAL